MKMGRPSVVPDPVFALQPLAKRDRRRQGKYRLGVALGSPFPSGLLLSELASPELINHSPFNAVTCLTPEEVLLYDFLNIDEQLRKEAFLRSVSQVLKSLSDDISVEFFGFGKMYGDQELAIQLASTCPRTRVVSVTDQNLETIQTLISSYDGLLLSRYHAAILALRAGRPFVVADPHWSHSTYTE